MRFNNLARLAIATSLVLGLAGCQSQDQDEAVSLATTEADAGGNQRFYTANIEDGFYDINRTRGIMVNAASQANLDGLDRALYDGTKLEFPTNDYILREGQAITADEARQWLAPKSQDNDQGLNPEQAAADKLDSFEPHYLNSIMSYDLLSEPGQGNDHLAGASVVLALNSQDIFQNESQTEVVDIDPGVAEEKGKEMAKEVVRRLRQKEGYQDIPIAVTLYLNGDLTDLAGGVALAQTVSNRGDSLGSWTNFDQKNYVFGTEELPNQEEQVAFEQFRTEIEALFPRLNGITGVARYENNNMVGIDVRITSQFDGYSEIIALAQKLSSSATSIFPSNIAIKIEVVSPSGTSAILARAVDEKAFNYEIIQ
ncbi:hypothetical protein AWM75_05360 [Aerococcus urinaehominis]|uniref:CamS family sex pheromone protein n=1 Tax=Aerococcus urinaehominis TaxID=128944 RepID=A0A109RH82_9LACT|nr:CamS family sex pheromone protein [Aerococcus urinaehominis]AMB99456.1 hypothetical protein AWM75_05360 [Aerococcus urinaehominis]